MLMLSLKFFRLLLLANIKVSNFIGKSLNLSPPHSSGATTPLQLEPLFDLLQTWLSFSCLKVSSKVKLPNGGKLFVFVLLKEHLFSSNTFSKLVLLI